MARANCCQNYGPVLLLRTAVAYCFVLLSSIASAAEIGDGCLSNGDCSAVTSSWCYISSPTCGGGACSCQPGFVQAPNSTTVCYTAQRLGSKCSRYDACVDVNTECINGICSCASGFTPSNGRCTTSIKNVGAGGTCYDTVQCIGNLVCYNNICGCYPEYSVSGCCDCAPKGNGAACASNDDCNYATRTVCKSGVCTCDYNAKVGTYMTLSPSQDSLSYVNQLTPKKCVTRTTCISSEYKMAAEGEDCSEPSLQDPHKPFKLCQMPFVCMACGNYKKVCASRPASCYRYLESGASSPQQHISSSPSPVATILALFSLVFAVVR